MARLCRVAAGGRLHHICRANLTKQWQTAAECACQDDVLIRIAGNVAELHQGNRATLDATRSARGHARLGAFYPNAFRSCLAFN